MADRSAIASVLGLPCDAIASDYVAEAVEPLWRAYEPAFRGRERFEPRTGDRLDMFRSLRDPAYAELRRLVREGSVALQDAADKALRYLQPIFG